MKKIKASIKYVWKNRKRYTVYIIVSLFVFFGSNFIESIQTWSIYIQIPLLIIYSFIEIVMRDFEPDKEDSQLKYLKKELYSARKQAKLVGQIKDSEKKEIEDVLVAFIENSEIYKKKIIKYLDLEEDYLCIAKSSEGLSEIFKKMEEKPMLPFSKILYEWPGSIKPFGNMSIYFIPVKNLDDFNINEVRKWVNENIIPKVEQERERFLNGLPQSLSKLSDKFSYKYIAFTVKKHSIQYDFKNRKFSKDFIITFIKAQPPKRIVKMSNELGEIVKAKDFFLLVEWSAFVKLNKDQNELIKERKIKIYDELVENNILTLIDLSKLSSETLGTIFKNSLGVKITNLKAKNLAKKIIDGSTHVLKVLRASGVNV